jgi:hypothetical protein
LATPFSSLKRKTHCLPAVDFVAAATGLAAGLTAGLTAALAGTFFTGVFTFAVGLAAGFAAARTGAFLDAVLDAIESVLLTRTALKIRGVDRRRAESLITETAVIVARRRNTWGIGGVFAD